MIRVYITVTVMDILNYITRVYITVTVMDILNYITGMIINSVKPLIKPLPVLYSPPETISVSSPPPPTTTTTPSGFITETRENIIHIMKVMFSLPRFPIILLSLKSKRANFT